MLLFGLVVLGVIFYLQGFLSLKISPFRCFSEVRALVFVGDSGLKSEILLEFYL